MKKRMIIGAIVLIACGAFAALDSSMLQNVTLLSAQDVAATRAVAVLVAPQSFATNAVVSGSIAKADYAGYVDIVLAFSGNDDAAYTNVVTIAQGPAAGTLTNTIATVAHGGDAIGVSTYRVTLADLTQAYLGVTFASETDNDKTNRFGATLIGAAIPATVNTVTGSAVDKSILTGTATIVLSVGAPLKASANYSGTFVLQSAAASTGAWANVTGATATITGAAGGIATIPFESNKGGKYIRGVYTATNDVAPVAATINSYKP